MSDFVIVTVNNTCVSDKNGKTNLTAGNLLLQRFPNLSIIVNTKSSLLI